MEMALAPHVARAAESASESAMRDQESFGANASWRPISKASGRARGARRAENHQGLRARSGTQRCQEPAAASRSPVVHVVDRWQRREGRARQAAQGAQARRIPTAGAGTMGGARRSHVNRLRKEGEGKSYVSCKLPR